METMEMHIQSLFARRYNLRNFDIYIDSYMKFESRYSIIKNDYDKQKTVLAKTIKIKHKFSINKIV